MSIFFVCFSIRPGGVAKVLSLLVSKLLDMGINVSVITDKEYDLFAREIFAKDTDLIFRPKEKKKIFFLREFLRKKKAANDVFFVGVQFNNLIWLSLAGIFLARRPPVISWEHSSPAVSIRKESPLMAFPIMALRFFCIGLSDACFFVSRGAMRNARYISPFWVKKFFTPNAVYCSTSSSYSCFHDRLKFDTPFKIVSVGRVSREKGLDIALLALAEVNFDWEYTIVGDGPELSSLQALVAENEAFTQKVNFLGWVEDPRAVMMNADVVLLASYYEGMPTVLIEACLLNIPIISSDCVSGPSEIITPYNNGLLFKVGNPKDLTDKLNFFFERRNEFSNSPEYVKEYEASFAAEKFVRNLQLAVSQ